jgi:hypothetical protein
MIRTIITSIVVSLAFQATLNAASDNEVAVISWRYERPGEGEQDPKYSARGAAIRYYWEGSFVGVGPKGLAEVYDRLKKFNGKSIVFTARPQPPEDDKLPGGPKYMDNPLERDDAFIHFYQLVRKKNVTFTIDFKDDPSEPRYGGPNYNPFRPDKE